MKETKMFQGPALTDNDPDALPDGLQPVPTSREGMAEMQKQKRARANQKLQHQKQDMQQLSQGYAANQETGIPHPTPSAISQPAMYEGMKGQGPVQDDLASAFGPKSQPSAEQVTAAVNDVRR
jgi:hypothetical protein